MPRPRAIRAPARWSDRLTDAPRQCTERAGFAMYGWSAGIPSDGIGVEFALAEPRLAVPAERVARTRVESASLQIGRRMIVEN